MKKATPISVSGCIEVSDDEGHYIGGITSDCPVSWQMYSAYDLW